ncbi:MAG: HpcH/HpaI aldolase/citrate lyase family protein [Pirellulales bacterium]
MENAHYFREKIASRETALGTCVTLIDPVVTEALSRVLDFVWIDTEHNPLSLERVLGHLLATKGSHTTPIVRVPANDPVLIKPVLDIGAAGVIVPLVKSADDVRLAVAACRYPPEGIRGFGPRRPSNYGARGGPEFCQEANREIITIVQIEQREALENIDAILAVPGLTSIVIGPNDLAASIGYTGQPWHPANAEAIEMVLGRARAAGIPLGMAIADDPQLMARWIDKGVKWLSIAADYGLLMRAACELVDGVRKREVASGQ